MSCRCSSTERTVPSVGGAFPAPADRDALLSHISAISQELRERPVFAYIVTTIETDTAFTLRQTGSAPNFAGGRITLCTCKHKDRATLALSGDPGDPWKHVWVAGLTGKSSDPSRSLAFLMCVERSFTDHRALWMHLPNACRTAKSASISTQGDLFEPKASAALLPHAPASYRLPIAGHVHAQPPRSNAWRGDLREWYGYGRKRPHRLLLGEAPLSFRWEKVAMVLDPSAIGATAHHKVFPSLDEFIAKIVKFENVERIK